MSLKPTAPTETPESIKLLPVWIRPPLDGLEYYTGLSRSKLYQLATDGLIKTASLRGADDLKGTRLFNLASILSYIEGNVEVAK